jgi:N-acetylglutamate synthase-like GNAT family acetyltransferase
MKLRPFNSSDKTTCLAIFESNLAQYFAENEREEFSIYLNEECFPNYWVLEDKGKILGCGGIYENFKDNSVGLAWGMIHNDHHKMGYGAFLTKFRVERMIEKYPTQIKRLATSQHTFPFYEKMGFKVTKITKKGFDEHIDRYDMDLV